MSKPDIAFSVPGMGRSARDDSVRCLELVPPAGVIAAPAPDRTFDALAEGSGGRTDHGMELWDQWLGATASIPRGRRG